MFTKFRFRNFRTHVETDFSPGAVTLIIGPNSSGKTNLLLGLRDFAYIGRLARLHPNYPLPNTNTSIAHYNFYNRYRWADRMDPIEFYCEWKSADGDDIAYSIELYQRRASAFCKEKLTLVLRSGEKKEYAQESDHVVLSRQVFAQNEQATPHEERLLISALFRDLGSIYYFHFEPSALRNLTASPRKSQPVADAEAVALSQEEELRAVPEDRDRTLSIPGELGQHGEGLHTVITEIKKYTRKYPGLYDRFRRLMEQYTPGFRDYSLQEEKPRGKWLFSYPGAIEFHAYEDNLLADGFLRACAISLLAAMHRPPSIILLEEIENGMDIVRLELMIDWLWEAATRTGMRNNCQFIVTSHSPIVLRRFWNRLADVYQVRFDDNERRSVVLNLEALLRSDIQRGHVKGRIVDGRAIVAPDLLVSLWVNRTIGGEAVSVGPES